MKSLAGHFRIVGNESKGRIVNSQGDTVIELGSNPHFDSGSGSGKCTVSPNEKRILVDYGADAAYDIVEPDIGLKVTLPIQPAGENKLGFGSWRWIDDDTLLGESGDEIVPRKTGAEGEGNNVAQTRLYIYLISKQELSEVQLPEDLGARVFDITESRPGGYVHLSRDKTIAIPTADLGWFKVHAK